MGNFMCPLTNVSEYTLRTAIYTYGKRALANHPNIMWLSHSENSMAFRILKAPGKRPDFFFTHHRTHSMIGRDKLGIITFTFTFTNGAPGVTWDPVLQQEVPPYSIVDHADEDLMTMDDLINYDPADVPVARFRDNVEMVSFFAEVFQGTMGMQKEVASAKAEGFVKEQSSELYMEDYNSDENVKAAIKWAYTQ